MFRSFKNAFRKIKSKTKKLFRSRNPDRNSPDRDSVKRIEPYIDNNVVYIDNQNIKEKNDDTYIDDNDYDKFRPLPVMTWEEYKKNYQTRKKILDKTRSVEQNYLINADTSNFEDNYKKLYEYLIDELIYNNNYLDKINDQIAVNNYRGEDVSHLEKEYNKINDLIRIRIDHMETIIAIRGQNNIGGKRRRTTKRKLIKKKPL
jgi:hypothetical protein